MPLKQVENFVEAVVAIQAAQVIEQLGGGLWSCRVAERLFIVDHDDRNGSPRAIDADEASLAQGRLGRESQASLDRREPYQSELNGPLKRDKSQAIFLDYALSSAIKS
jgi:hypothetical protein